MTERAHRYALYYAPQANSPWWRAGSQWLGRCAATGEVLDQPLVPGLSAHAFSAVTAAPRRYGWHATLKAPFALRQNMQIDALYAVVEDLAGALLPFDIPTLQVRRLDDFLALTPQSDKATEAPTQTHALALQTLEGIARVCVQELTPLAAPLSAADLQRRRQALLTPAQDALLVRWGYPYVMEEFRFHCSLTGSLKGLDPAQTLALQHAAEGIFHALPPCRFDSLALFEEPTPGADFRLVRHFGLRA